MGSQLVGDQLSMGTEFDGDHLSRGINLMGIVCPGRQEVGDRKSGIKWVRDHMRSSQICLLEHLIIEQNLPLLVLCGHAQQPNNIAKVEHLALTILHSLLPDLIK